MENIRDFWRELWNKSAGSDNVFVQSGRSSYTPLEFLLAVRDVSKALGLNREDIVLDAGGGVGWISMFISPFVKRAVVFDYAPEMIKKAKELTAYFENITAVEDDILFMRNITGIYTKVIGASVLQYLENFQQVKTALANVYNVMSKGAKAIFSHHPDISRKSAHIASYSKLDWDKDRIKNALEMEEKRLWFDFAEIRKIADEIGFSDCLQTPINPKLWQSTHMLDFVLTK